MQAGGTTGPVVQVSQVWRYIGQLCPGSAISQWEPQIGGSADTVGGEMDVAFRWPRQHGPLIE